MSPPQRWYHNRRLVRVVAFCLPLGLMVFMYVTVFRDSRHSVTIKLDYNSAHFYVDRYDVKQDTFDIIGHFYDTFRKKNESQKSILRLLGVEKLVNMFKSERKKLLSDESFFTVSETVDYTNCAALFGGDEEEINNTIAINDNFNSTDSLTPNDYLAMTADCTNFTTSRRYIMDPLSEVERDFPIAYSILMYKHIEQFERLLRAIYRPQNFYCIHVDLASVGDIFHAVVAIAECFPNVYVTETRVKVKWGQMSVLEPELKCMELLHRTSNLWKYFINLTGQEFPLKTNYELVQILKAYNGANDVLSTRKRANKERWKNKGQPPHGIIPAKGSVHVALSRGYVEYALNNTKAHDLLKWVRTTKIPDETFFATLNSNPHLKVPGAYAGGPETDCIYEGKYYLARFKNWGESPCHGHFMRGICVFGVGDLPVLAQRRELFANKFVWGYQRAARDCLEELMYNRTRDQLLGCRSFDASWYADLGFVKNQVKPDN